MNKLIKFLKRIFRSIRSIDTPVGGLSWELSDISDKEVDINFPADSSLQEVLKSQGYEISWCASKKVSRRINIDGYEKVIWEDKNGVKFHLVARGGLTLIKRKVT